jgi:hypothetical protein
MKHFILLSTFFFIAVIIQAQTTPDRRLVQFSGVVIGNDSLEPIPYTSVIIKGSKRGTISDYFGYFSFVAQEGDVLEFSAIGFRKQQFIIPSNLPENKYSLIQALGKDTIQLNEVVIKNWPSKEQFKQAFINLNLDNGLTQVATMNLERIKNNANYTQLENDAQMAYRQVQQQQYSQMYVANAANNNWLNPVAWSQFIKSWKKEQKKK